MNKTTLIVLEKSYLLRRGIVAALQDIVGTDLILEYEQPGQVPWPPSKLSTTYLIVRTQLMSELAQHNHPLARRVLSVKYIGIGPADGELLGELSFETILQPDDSQATVHDKLTQLLHAPSPRENDLTQRENDIVRCIALGKTNKEIADNLFISPHTVITHRKNITQKLGIKSVSGLTVFAILNNLITVDEVNE